MVLKGGSTPNREGFDNPWKPLDDYQAPYREPKLPPPDFVPEENGVGVPLEDEDEDIPKDGHKEEEEFEYYYDDWEEIINNNNDDIETKAPAEEDEDKANADDNSIDSETPYQLFKDIAFPDHYDDEEQFINDMENFHAVRQALSQLPPPVTAAPPENFFQTPTAVPKAYSYSYFTSTEKPTLSVQTTPTTTAASPTTTPVQASTTPTTTTSSEEAEFFSTRRLRPYYPSAFRAKNQNAFNSDDVDHYNFFDKDNINAKKEVKKRQQKFSYMRDLKTKPQPLPQPQVQHRVHGEPVAPPPQQQTTSQLFLPSSPHYEFVPLTTTTASTTTTTRPTTTPPPSP